LPELVEQVPVRSCVRRGAAIDPVLDRGREARSQLSLTTARGREVVFWQPAQTRKQARPAVRTPSRRPAGAGPYRRPLRAEPGIDGRPMWLARRSGAR
jgi:hypothetical protein